MLQVQPISKGNAVCDVVSQIDQWVWFIDKYQRLVIRMFQIKGKKRQGELRQDMFEVSDRESKSNSRYCLHKLSKHKNRNVTRSLHSIEVKTNSLQLHHNPKHTATKTILLSDRENPHSRSSRKITIDSTSKVRILDRIMNLRNSGLAEKLHTIEGEQLQQNEKKLIGCIQMMQGVLEEIQNQKQNRQMFKSIRFLQPEKPPKLPHHHQPRSNDKGNNDKGPTLAQKENRNDEKSKFEEYIQNVCQTRESSKVLLIRRAKTRSNIITNEELKASLVVNPKRFQTIGNERPQNCQPPQSQQPKRIPKIQIIVETGKPEKGLQQMQVSAIDKVNQSSFISDCGKKELMGDLSSSRRCVLTQLNEGKGSKRSSHQQAAGSASKNIEVNHRKVCKVKNSKKLKSIFPNGFF